MAASADVRPMLTNPTSAAIKNDLKTLLNPGRGTALLPLILKVFHTMYQPYYQKAIPNSSKVLPLPTPFRYMRDRFGYDKTKLRVGFPDVRPDTGM